jgi:hypothetical protein
MKVGNSSGLFAGHLAMGLNCTLLKSCERKTTTYYAITSYNHNQNVHHHNHKSLDPTLSLLKEVHIFTICPLTSTLTLILCDI